jgi:hypothetical protein
MAWFLAASICACASSATTRGGLGQRAFGSPSCPLASDHRRCSSVASACRTIGGEDLEAVGLTGLALEAFDLGFELGRDVVEALEIGLGGAQPEFGLMAARMQAGNAGRFFKQLRLRACGLAWISSPMRPCPTIEGERAPVEASAKRSCTSLARASLPLMR